MRSQDAREQIVQRLSEDLVGPLASDETLVSNPSDVYLSGMLWPMKSLMGAEEDDGSPDDDEEDQGASSVSLSGQSRPCSMGLSFASKAAEGEHVVSVAIHFGTYSWKEGVGGGKTGLWYRHQHDYMLDVLIPDARSHGAIPISVTSTAGLTVELAYRHIFSAEHGTLTTFTLINKSNPEESDRRTLEHHILFQTAMIVRPKGKTGIEPRPSSLFAEDSDARSGLLLYRNTREYATGHQCSADWRISGNAATELRTTWLPRVTVPAFREDGDDVFRTVADSDVFDALSLSRENSPEMLCQRLSKLPSRA